MDSESYHKQGKQKKNTPKNTIMWPESTQKDHDAFLSKVLCSIV